jgi:ribosomal protein S12 methylthiotransferase accessory factor
MYQDGAMMCLPAVPDWLDGLLAAWDELVDPRVGIVRQISPLPIEEDEPNFVHYLSTACDTAQLTRLTNFANNGGVSTTQRGALAKALGEAVERYCSAFFAYSDLTVAAFDELLGPATPPESYALYTDDQYASGDIPWRPFTRTTPVSWTRGTSLVTGQPVQVPAAMVFVPYHYRRDSGEIPVVLPISTGLAAGSSYASAALSGLCEAIERDAFTITWQAMLSRRRLRVDSSAASLDRLRRFTDAGIHVELMDITTDIAVPSVLTVAICDSPSSPAIAVAAATHPDAETAVVKSLEELAHTRKFARQVMDYTPSLPIEPETGHPAVQDQKHHLRFYCEQQAVSFAAFTWASPDELNLSDLTAGFSGTPEQLLAGTVERVRRADLDVVACDLTTPDIAELGLSVVRVVVPGLHPLFMGHSNRARGGTRLYVVPDRLGLRGLALGQADNPYPHPFP